MFFAYAIYNQVKDKLYIGQSANLEIRLLRHNKKLPNKSKSYTSKNSGTWGIIHKECFDTRNKAITRERELKSYRGREFLRGIINKQYPPVAQR